MLCMEKCCSCEKDALLVFDMIQHVEMRFLIVHIHRLEAWIVWIVSVNLNFISHRCRKLKVELDKIRLSMSNVYPKYLNLWHKTTWKSLKCYRQYRPCCAIFLIFNTSCGCLLLSPFLLLPLYFLVPILQSSFVFLCNRTWGSLAPRVSCFPSWLMWWCGRGLGWYSERPFKGCLW